MTATWVGRADDVLEEAGHSLDESLPTNPVVVMIGPYDGGKSTILLRLAIDTGEPVPEWLTISAREETFAENSLHLLGATFVDTPGLGSLSADHEDIARRAAERADALVVVLPPQLITDEGVLTSILAGTLFHPDGWTWPEGALTFVISRFDEAGADPEEDPLGYRDLATRKSDELRQLLSNLGHNGAADIHTVAANPFALVDEPRVATAHSFDAGRNWDGIAGLRPRLEQLTSNGVTLRRATEVRRRLTALSRLCGQLQDRIVRETHALSDCENEIEAWKQRAEDLAVLDHTSRQRLENELRAMTTSMRTASPTRDDVARRLEQAVNAWARAVDAQLEALSKQFGEDFERFQTTIEYKLQDWDTPERRNRVQQKRQLITELAGALRDVLAIIDETIPADKVKIRARLTRAGFLLSDEAINSGLTLVNLIGDLHADATHQAEIEALREQIREHVAAIADEILDGPWAAAIGRLQVGVNDALAGGRSHLEDIGSAITKARESLDAAEDLLSSAPRPEMPQH